MEIDHSDQTVQQEGYDVLGHDMEKSEGTRLRSNSVNNKEKNAAVHAEIERVSRLPSNSSYAVHRMRVLNKILNLISVQVSMKVNDFIMFFFGLHLLFSHINQNILLSSIL